MAKFGSQELRDNIRYMVELSQMTPEQRFAVDGDVTAYVKAREANGG